MRYVFLALAALTLSACTSESGATRALTSAGFTNIELTGYAPFNCSEQDFTSTGFAATNPAGQRVTGVVCCGVLKSCTIRY